MPQSLSQVIVHLVFSTKNREPWIDITMRPRLHAYLATLARDHGCEAYQVGGVGDHVHLAIALGRTVSQSELVEHIKTGSSKWIKTQGMQYGAFCWQRGYGAFSISPTHLDALREYIDGQEEHHRHESFQDEYRRLLEKCGLSCDERYVWD